MSSSKSWGYEGLLNDQESLNFQTKSSAKGSKFKRCYHGHKPLPLKDGLVIHGGSCSDPVPGLDNYIGFDRSMAEHAKRYPWVPGEAFSFLIRDYYPPDSAEDTMALVDWVILKLKAGESVHMGCIGGHGRTGTILAAIVARMGVSDDPIKYVRENYCKRAVESQGQIDFLVKHFNCKPAAISKPPLVSSSKLAGSKSAGFKSSAGSGKKGLVLVRHVRTKNTLF